MTAGLFAAGDLGGAIKREADVEGEFRWSLKRTWNVQLPRAAWLMCNPSTADDQVDDPTIRRVMRFSREAGCGSAIVVNVFPLRTPYPADLWPRLADLDHEAIRRNMVTIELAAQKAAIRFVAFGAEPYGRAPALTAQAVRVFGLRQGAAKPVVALGTNSAGWPLHPLARGKSAIRNGTKPVPWGFPDLPAGALCRHCAAWSSWAAMTGDCLAWAIRRRSEFIKADFDVARDPSLAELPAAVTWADDACPEFQAKPASDAR